MTVKIFVDINLLGNCEIKDEYNWFCIINACSVEINKYIFNFKKLFSFLFVKKIDVMQAIREFNTFENHSRDAKYVVLSWNILYIPYKIKYYFMKMIIMIFVKHIIEEMFN